MGFSSISASPIFAIDDQILSFPTRNYVTQDILRRIVSDYFGYDVHFVMNITDIEDKVRSRRRCITPCDQHHAARDSFYVRS
jgi:hypothetical protein